MGKKNTGKDYEELVRRVIDGLVRIEGCGLSNVEVRSNVCLEGITALPDGSRSKHQIDVFWEFDIGLTSYKTVIQAKDWKKKIRLPELHTFLSVLADLPGNPKGIMVTTKGYQKGVEQLAQARGVDLCLLKLATPEDFDGDVPVLDATICPFFNRVEQARVSFEEPLADKQSLVRYMTQNPHEIPLLNEEGNQVGVFSKLYSHSIQEMMREMMSSSAEKLQRSFAQKVDPPLFVRCAPGAKLEKVSFVQFFVTVFRVAPRVSLTNAITHIFRSATGDKTYTVDQNFRVMKLGDDLSIEHVFDLGSFVKPDDFE